MVSWIGTQVVHVSTILCFEAVEREVAGAVAEGCCSSNLVNGTSCLATRFGRRARQWAEVANLQELQEWCVGLGRLPGQPGGGNARPRIGHSCCRMPRAYCGLRLKASRPAPGCPLLAPPMASDGSCAQRASSCSQCLLQTRRLYLCTSSGPCLLCSHRPPVQLCPLCNLRPPPNPQAMFQHPPPQGPASCAAIGLLQACRPCLSSRLLAALPAEQLCPLCSPPPPNLLRSPVPLHPLLKHSRLPCCPASFLQTCRAPCPPPPARCALHRCWWAHMPCSPTAEPLLPLAPTWWPWLRRSTPRRWWCWWGCTSCRPSSRTTPTCCTTTSEVRRDVGLCVSVCIPGLLHVATEMQHASGVHICVCMSVCMRMAAYPTGTACAGGHLGACGLCALRRWLLSQGASSCARSCMRACACASMRAHTHSVCTHAAGAAP